MYYVQRVEPIFSCCFLIFAFQIFEVKLESSVVEQLNVPKMIDKYPQITFFCVCNKINIIDVL